MSKKNQEKLLEVKKRTISLISAPAEKFSLKVNNLIESHFSAEHKFPGNTINTLIEIKLSCDTLNEYLRDLLTQMDEAGTNSVFLSPTEIQAIAQLAKAVEMASGSNFNNINLLEH